VAGHPSLIRQRTRVPAGSVPAGAQGRFWELGDWACILPILVEEAADAVASLDLVDLGWCAMRGRA
jgi:hypothetical protein